MAITPFVTGDALTQARLAQLVNEITSLTDKRPAAANAEDDEFDGISPGAAWSLYNAGSNLTVSLNKSRLILSLAQAESASAMRGIMRATPAAGAWRYEITGMRNTIWFGGQIGLAVRKAGGTAPNVANVTTDKTSYLCIVGGQAPTLYVQRWTNANTYNTYDKGGLQANGLAAQINGFAIAFDGTDTLHFYYTCDNGASWTSLGTVSATTVCGGAPDSIGLVIDAAAGQNTYNDGGFVMSVEAFRRVA